jgi:hypothetical protein
MIELLDASFFKLSEDAKLASMGLRSAVAPK